jgi:hypothetical protein
MRLSVLSYMTCAVGLGVLGGCPDRAISPVKPIQTGAVTKGIPVEADIDILFVVDNSASTADKQALFAANFPRFVQALDMFPSGMGGMARPNLHIGVVSTTVGTGGMEFLPNCPKTAPNDDGLLQNTARVAGCSPPNGRFISDIANGTGGRTVNYSGTLDQELPCIATLGTTGCGFEAQLEAMKRALDGTSQPQNAGFIRAGAYLAVIFLTDEDDCSVKDPSIFALNNVGPGDFRCQPLYAYKCDTPISNTNGSNYTGCKPATGGYLQDTSFYYNFLTGIKDPSQIVVAAIAGVDSNGKQPDSVGGLNITTGAISSPFSQSLALEPQCMNNSLTPPGIGRPGLRLSDFVSQFGNRGRYYSVCDNDFSPALADIGQLLFNAISPCLEGPIDVSSFNAGIAGEGVQCTVSDIQNFGSSGQMETQIPPCPMTGPGMPAAMPRPCWWVAVDATKCPDNVSTPTHLVLNVERSMPPAIGTTEVVSCAVSSM